LEHKIGDDTVEGGSSVAEPVLASAEFTEVSGGVGYDIVVELEFDTPDGLVVNTDVELLRYQYGFSFLQSELTDEYVRHGGSEGAED
jgi:hypothetical protein